MLTATSLSFDNNDDDDNDDTAEKAIDDESLSLDYSERQEREATPEVQEKDRFNSFF